MTWILTASGRRFDYLDPRPQMIDLGDIATALSREARFNGHTVGFYSVAQHCLLASHLVPSAFALEALLHDASEAYMKDIPRPLKALLPEYKAIEARVERAIRKRFGLPLAMSACVKEADLVMLATERRDLMPVDSEPWPVLEGVLPAWAKIQALDPASARFHFLARLGQLIDPDGEELP